jgi:hypothetical protein
MDLIRDLIVAAHAVTGALLLGVAAAIAQARAFLGPLQAHPSTGSSCPSCRT